MKNQSIYFDHNATTPLCSEARTAMQPFLEGSSAIRHPTIIWAGRPEAALQAARRTHGRYFQLQSG